jgi:hypothetical protein
MAEVQRHRGVSSHRSPSGSSRPRHQSPTTACQHDAQFERMSDEEIIKAIEERANKLGIKVNLSYDFGSGWSDDAQ